MKPTSLTLNIKISINIIQTSNLYSSFSNPLQTNQKSLFIKIIVLSSLPVTEKNPLFMSHQNKTSKAKQEGISQILNSQGAQSNFGNFLSNCRIDKWRNMCYQVPPSLRTGSTLVITKTGNYCYKILNPRKTLNKISVPNLKLIMGTW